MRSIFSKKLHINPLSPPSKRKEGENLKIWKILNIDTSTHIYPFTKFLLLISKYKKNNENNVKHKRFFIEHILL